LTNYQVSIASTTCKRRGNFSSWYLTIVKPDFTIRDVMRCGVARRISQRCKFSHNLSMTVRRCFFIWEANNLIGDAVGTC
jgi:hypothetical protein